MVGKVVFGAGVGVGYVLGTRAGQQRYEEIMRKCRSLTERPEFQETAGLVTAQAGGLIRTAKDLLATRVAPRARG